MGSCGLQSQRGGKSGILVRFEVVENGKMDDTSEMGHTSAIQVGDRITGSVPNGRERSRDKVNNRYTTSKPRDVIVFDGD